MTPEKLKKSNALLKEIEEKERELLKAVEDNFKVFCFAQHKHGNAKTLTLTEEQGTMLFKIAKSMAEENLKKLKKEFDLL